MSTEASKIEKVTQERMAASWFEYVSRRRRGGRRRERERPPQFQVEVVVDAAETIRYDVFDLSASGLYLNSEFLHPPGEEFEMCLRLGEGVVALRLIGEVVRAQTSLTRRPPGMAVKFRNLAPAERRAIEDYIERLGWRKAGNNGRS